MKDQVAIDPIFDKPGGRVDPISISLKVMLLGTIYLGGHLRLAVEPGPVVGHVLVGDLDDEILVPVVLGDLDVNVIVLGKDVLDNRAIHFYGRKGSKAGSTLGTDDNGDKEDQGQGNNEEFFHGMTSLIKLAASMKH